MNTAGLWQRWIVLCKAKSMPREKQDGHEKTTYEPILPEFTAGRLADEIRMYRVETDGLYPVGFYHRAK